jgi:hypothetical protein
MALLNLLLQKRSHGLQQGAKRKEAVIADRSNVCVDRTHNYNVCFTSLDNLAIPSTRSASLAYAKESRMY